MLSNQAPRCFKVVLFDLGDTLIYFEGNWAATFELAKQRLVQSLKSAGLKIEAGFLAEFSARMGNYFRYRDAELVEHTTRFILENLLRETGFQDVPDETMRGALADMYAVTQEHWLPEPDALPTLNQLSKLGYQMALVSNAADDENTQTLVDKLGAKNYFSAILSSAAIGIRKPDPRIFQMALEQMNASPNQAVMVGDTLGADILGAKNVGIYSIWITRRADTAANKTHVKTIIPDTSIFALSELPDLLESLSRSNY